MLNRKEENRRSMKDIRGDVNLKQVQLKQHQLRVKEITSKEEIRQKKHGKKTKYHLFVLNLHF